jgi:hypothetical protein
MTSASMKRIIWGIGFMAVWAFNDSMLVSAYGNTGSISYQLTMLATLVIPLFIFKDDSVTRRKENENN